MRGQGRIFKRGGVWWIGYSRRGREYRESSKSTKEAEAKKLLKKRWEEIHGKRFVGPSEERVMFSDLLDDLERDYQLNGKRSLRTLRIILKHVRAVFGMDRAIDVTKGRVAKYRAERIAAGAAPGSINRELSAIGRAFSIAVDNEILSTMPGLKKLKLKEDNARQGFVEPADFEALAKELPEYLADFSRFAYLTGWRRGEISSLTWADCDLEGKTVRLLPENSKNSEGRVIPLEGDLLSLIQKRYLARVGTTKDGDAQIIPHVFHRRGEPIGECRMTWEKAVEKAKLPSGLLFHDLRRSAVMNMRRAGVSEGVIMQFTGHKTRNVFERYNIKTLDDLRAAQERTQGYLKAQPTARKVDGMPTSERKHA